MRRIAWATRLLALLLVACNDEGGGPSPGGDADADAAGDSAGDTAVGDTADTPIDDPVSDPPVDVPSDADALVDAPADAVTDADADAVVEDLGDAGDAPGDGIAEDSLTDGVSEDVSGDLEDALGDAADAQDVSDADDVSDAADVIDAGDTPDAGDVPDAEPECGDGAWNGEEACDGSVAAGDDGCNELQYCAPDCTGCLPLCGNGVVDAGEDCDDASQNGLPGWHCSAGCTLIVECGDGLVDPPGETCETPLIPGPTGCDPDGVTPICVDPLGGAAACTCIASPGCPDGVTPADLSDDAFRIGEFDIWRDTGTLPGAEGVDGGDYVPPLLCSYSAEIDFLGGSTGVEAVYTFTAPEAGLYRFSTERSADLGAGIVDTVLSLRTGCDPRADVLACDDDGSGVLLLSTLYEPLEAGQTVAVVVEAWESSENAAEYALEAARVTFLGLGDPCGDDPLALCDGFADAFCLDGECRLVTGAPVLETVEVTEVSLLDARCGTAPADLVFFRFSGQSARDIVAWSFDHPVATYLYGVRPALFLVGGGPIAPEAGQFEFVNGLCFPIVDDVPTLPVVQPGGENPIGLTVLDDVGHSSGVVAVEITTPP